MTRLWGTSFRGKVNHPARKALLWHNLFFGTRHRKVRVTETTNVAFAPLSIFPDVADELGKYMKVMGKAQWQELLTETKSAVELPKRASKKPERISAKEMIRRLAEQGAMKPKPNRGKV